MKPLTADWNERAAQIWAAIENSGHDFAGQRVLDGGCGYGDMLWRVAKAGASQVYGMDKDPGVLQLCNLRVAQHGDLPVYTFAGDLNSWSDIWPGHHHAVLLLSVLPYLDDPARTLQLVAETSDVAFIECQYYGDGPGLAFIRNDADMQDWLLANGWSLVEVVGRSLVVDRQCWRTVWYCRS